METDFGSGLRAHLERRSGGDPAPEAEFRLDPAAAELTRRVAELDERERMLTQAGAELAYRERRLLEREAALIAAAQKVAEEVVVKLLDDEPPVDDELARARERRANGVA